MRTDCGACVMIESELGSVARSVRTAGRGLSREPRVTGCVPGLGHAICNFIHFKKRISMNLKMLMAATGLAVIGLIMSAPTFAASKAEIDASADKALQHFYALNPRNRELADKAMGVLVFGKLTKGGAGVAGEFGEGVLRVKGKNVDYYNMASGSVGLTLGVAEHSEVILFMTQAALDKFTQSDGWSAGADASVAVVSKGASAEYDTKTLSKPVLGFIFDEKGLLGDLSFEGSKITKIKTTK